MHSNDSLVLYFLGCLILLANAQVRYHREEKEGVGNEVIKIGISFSFLCKQELVAQWPSRLSKEKGGIGTEPSAWPRPLAGHREGTLWLRSLSSC